MGQVTNRSSLTSRGWLLLGTWLQRGYEYSVLMLNLGNNPNSRIEVASLLNCLNIGHSTLYFGYRDCINKYNPKVYMGAVQSVSKDWNSDLQTGQTNGLENQDGSSQKSGS